MIPVTIHGSVGHPSRPRHGIIELDGYRLAAMIERELQKALDRITHPFHHTKEHDCE